MKRIVVTGASGFIGCHALSRLLERGYEVHAVARRVGAPAANVHWHAANLLDRQQASALVDAVRPTHLLHFAWYGEHGKFWAAPQNLDWVGASIHLLEAFTHAGGQRFVGVGSCAEYDWTKGHCRENETPLVPGTLYGTCKDLFRRYLEARALTSGLSWAWGRVFHLHGPAEHPARLVAAVIEALARDQPAACTSGEQVRDFMHVADAADAFVALLDSPVHGAVNIASGHPVAVKDLVTQIADLMQKRPLLRLGALPDRAGDPAVLTAEVRRLTQEVGWPLQHDLTSRLKDTLAWWRDRRSAPAP